MSTPATFTYKQGVSLRFGAQLLADDGTPLSGVGVDVSSAATHKESGVVQVLVPVWIDQSQGSFECWAPGDTTCATWATGTWECDVLISRAGAAHGGQALVEATETINLFIEKRP